VITGTRFYRLVILPVISVKALHGTQSTNLYQWPGLFPYSSAIVLLMEGALLHLCCLQRQYQLWWQYP